MPVIAILGRRPRNGAGIAKTFRRSRLPPRGGGRGGALLSRQPAKQSPLVRARQHGIISAPFLSRLRAPVGRSRRLEAVNQRLGSNRRPSVLAVDLALCPLPSVTELTLRTSGSPGSTVRVHVASPP